MFQGGSRFYLRPHTHIQITNNHAKRGGGIYVEDQNAATTIPCFFQIVELQYPYSHLDSMITLKNNTAQEAGSAVYGGRIDQCYLLTSTQPVADSGGVRGVQMHPPLAASNVFLRT